MEKELLILGIVRTGELHGYRLWELVEAVPTGIRLRRSNAYRILESLERRGLVARRSEREGNRPRRNVYSITPPGELEFQRMLRDSLSADRVVDLPNAVALNYLDTLDAAEAVELLGRRLASVQARVDDRSELSEAALQRHPGVAFAVAYDRFELDFLSRLIDRLASAEAAG